MLNILSISKNEALKLNKEYNVPFGENGISHTYAKYHHYFLCPSGYNLSALDKIRKDRIAK